jgi:outer membrane receptor protein involved in Fe transport
VSPRLGISHPIDENTVLHFSYGHFFQRGSFGDYGEGNSDAQSLGSLTTFIVKGTTTPWVLGNRETKPEKTVAYELGVERNFFEEFVLGVTAYYKDIRNTLRVVTIEGPGGVYRTNGNGDYADVRGVEVWLRKQASSQSWGTTWGYLNFTTQIGITGRNGDPVAISPTRVLYGSSGDFIVHSNPRLKAGFFYQTPESWDLLGGVLGGIGISVDYQAVFPNDQLFGDFFEVGGKKYVRHADQNTNLRIRKDVSFGDHVRLGVYMEVRNLFNDQWLNLSAFEVVSPADQQKFVASDFEYIPSFTSNGVPILDLAKYRNLPRSIILGATLEL